MLIGVPKEIKSQEHRIGLTPDSVRVLAESGHDVLIEKGAGQGIFATDQDYKDVGAIIVPDADSVFTKATLIVKVKEPQLSECAKLNSNHILFTYLHLAPDPKQAKALMQSGCTAIAYETVTGEGGKGLPLLRPMSEVAGRMAPLMGAFYGAKHFGGRGHLISGVTGATPLSVLILGGGISGFAAAQMAHGMGAHVTITDMNADRLSYIKNYFGGEVVTQKADQYDVRDNIHDFDMVIGAVLIPGASAPKLVTRDMLSLMKPQAMLVDIAIDQGGCFETSRPTTHDDPVFEVDGIRHYCVANMPGAYPLTSTEALNDATLPYIRAIADKGLEKSLKEDEGLCAGVNVRGGGIVHVAVKDALGL